MKIRPMNDRILVVRVEEEKKTAGGIIIPDTAKEKPQKGKIIAVGEGRKDDNGKRIQMDVAEGDMIMFGKYSGSEIKVDNVEYLIMHESDIIAKLV
ncbi:MAG TPA: co-chaperone GroES [Desulfobacterales bacterium]|nr:co-chaperone GroES [Desulfobacterales bacterium]